MAAIYLTCKECFSRTRVEKIEPPMQVTNTFHCPCCGNVTPWSTDQDEDYWYDLAAAFKLPKSQEGVTIIRELYDMWDTTEHTSFRKFVEELKAE